MKTKDSPLYTQFSVELLCLLILQVLLTVCVSLSLIDGGGYCCVVDDWACSVFNTAACLVPASWTIMTSGLRTMDDNASLHKRRRVNCLWFACSGHRTHSHRLTNRPNKGSVVVLVFLVVMAIGRTSCFRQ